MPHLALDNCRLYYEEAGSGPPLLFLHGLGSSTRDWEWQVAAFSGGYRIITMDARGHGRSDKPPGPYRMAQFAHDTATLLRTLEAAPAHVVGLSMGSMIALQLAVDAPELLRSLTLVNGYVSFVPTTRQAQREIRYRKRLVRLLGMRAVGHALARQLFPDPAHALQRRVMAARWAENDKRAYLASIDAIVGWSVRDRLSGITCPTLVVAAEHDYTPVSHKRAYTRRLPNAELVVLPNAHHAVPVEYPEAFNEVLRTFLEKLSA